VVAAAAKDAGGDSDSNGRENKGHEKTTDGSSSSNGATTKMTAPTTATTARGGGSASNRSSCSGGANAPTTTAPAPATTTTPTPSVGRSGRQRVKFGGGRDHPLRDLAWPLAAAASFVGLLFWATMDAGKNAESGGSSEQQSSSWTYFRIKRLADAVNEAQSSLASIVAETVLFGDGSESLVRSGPCRSLYASESTIPGAGQSLFAGRDYGAGEVVVPAPPYLVPIRQQRQQPRRPDLNDNNDDDFFVLAPPHAFLLKHHPSLVNVAGKLLLADAAARAAQEETEEDGDRGTASTINLEQFELRATKPIPAGSELFVSYRDHPHSLLDASAGERMFGRIPGQDRYDLADAVFSDAFGAVRAVQVGHAKNKNHGGGQRGSAVVSPIYANFRRAVGRIDPRISILLPATNTEAEIYRKKKTSALASLRVQTTEQLQRRGVCLSDDIELSDKNDSNPHDGSAEAVAAGNTGRVITATRNVKKGEIIGVVHLHAVKNPMTCSASGSSSSDYCSSKKQPAVPYNEHCIGQESSQVLLCPLALDPAMKRLIMPGNKREIVSENGEREAAATNIEVYWTDGKTMPRTPLLDLQEGSIPAGSLSWTVAATADIEAGEEVRSSTEMFLPGCGRLSFHPRIYISHTHVTVEILYIFSPVTNSSSAQKHFPSWCSFQTNGD